MTGTQLMDDPTKPPRTDGLFSHWIPRVFVGLFLLVLAVNGTMIVIAVSTFTGLETTNAYEKGLAYNNRLAAAAEQDSWGWRVDLVTASKGGQRVMLALTLSDRLGNPITSAGVDAELLRPVQEGHDVAVRLNDQGQGRYTADIELPLPGQWDIRITVMAREKTYQLTERLHVAP